MRTALGLFPFLLLFATAHVRAAAAPLPDMPGLLARMMARARAVGADTNLLVHHFIKTSWYEKLDAAGTTTGVKEKRYEVTLFRGMPQNRLVAVNGQPLSAEEGARQTEGERKVRNRFSASGSARGDESVSTLINGDLAARFEFRAERREEIHGRPAIVVSFRPKDGPLPVNRLADRVINLLHGTIWVDEAEAEIARAEVRTEGAMRLWGGFLGAVEKVEFEVWRTRTPAGAWLNEKGLFTVRGRRLWEPLHFRAREVASEIREGTLTPELRAQAD
ncbi:MAG: hypothetical protein ACKVYV_09460 [Limisphaerales bacterium]